MYLDASASIIAINGTWVLEVVSFLVMLAILWRWVYPPIAAAAERRQKIISDQLAQDGWFLLKVRGDSMVNAGILDGDLVLVRPQPSADNGQIIVAMVDSEATVKRLDRRNGAVRLLPENDDYEPIVEAVFECQG